MPDSAIMVHIQLDTKGLYCPDPIMMLRKAIRQLVSGDVVEVIATDPSTSWDIPRFCVHMNHELLLQEQIETEQHKKLYRYLVKKGG